MTVENWKDLGIAVITAAPGIAALIWNILRTRTKVKVKVKYALGVGSLHGREMIAIEVINKGVRDINIQEYGFLCSDNRMRLIDLAANHSGQVRSGDSISYYIPIQNIKDMVREAKEKSGLKVTGAYVRDATDNYYRSRLPKSIKKSFFS